MVGGLGVLLDLLFELFCFGVCLVLFLLIVCVLLIAFMVWVLWICL